MSPAERLLLAIAPRIRHAPPARALAAAGVNAQALNQTIEQVRKGRTADSPNAEEKLRGAEEIHP